MTPITCDHADCNARATVFTTVATGQLTFCCHHRGALQSALAERATAVRVASTCRADLARPSDDPLSIGDGPTLAA